MARTTKKPAAKKAVAKRTPTTKRTTTVRKTQSKSTRTVVLLPTEEQIRMRAYAIYERRNGAPGTPDGDWKLAEHELRAELARR